MSKGRSISKFLKLVSEEVDLNPDEQLIYKQATKILELEKKSMDKDTENFIKHIQKQTPITPESLEGIGFEEMSAVEGITLILNNEYQIDYFLIDKKFYLTTSRDSNYSDSLFFESTEQIVEWIKPFKEDLKQGENNNE
jgi:hypothetical protein